MNKLIIYTKHPGVVASLLKTYDLVEGTPHLPDIGATENLEVYYPDDAISLALGYWFVMAIGCGLVKEYELRYPWQKRERSAQEILQPYVKLGWEESMIDKSDENNVTYQCTKCTFEFVSITGKLPTKAIPIHCDQTMQIKPASTQASDEEEKQ